MKYIAIDGKAAGKAFEPCGKSSYLEVPVIDDGIFPPRLDLRDVLRPEHVMGCAREIYNLQHIEFVEQDLVHRFTVWTVERGKLSVTAVLNKLTSLALADDVRVAGTLTLASGRRSR